MAVGEVDTSSLWTNTISLQPEVILSLTLGFPGSFHIVMHYSTPKRKGRARVRARILVVDEAGFHSCCDCKWRGCLRLAVFSSLHLACCLLINPLTAIDLCPSDTILSFNIKPSFTLVYSKPCRFSQLCVTLLPAEWSQSNSACWPKRWEAELIPCGSEVH